MDTVFTIILVPVINFLILVVKGYGYVMIARAIMSFFVQDYYSNPLVNFVYRITEPVLHKARALLPFLRMGMFDFSILAVFLILNILERALYVLLIRVGGGF